MVVVTAGRGWAYFDPEYESLNASLNPPRVVIENAAFTGATVIKLDSVNRHGILLEVVQVLTDLDLFISKAYVSSDAGWFMDVFHVTDIDGNKITDEEVLKFIQESLEKKAAEMPWIGSKCSNPSKVCSAEGGEITRVSLGTGPHQHTAIELSGPNRPGLLSEVFSTLSSMNCNVRSAAVWTHNLRVAGMIFVDNACSSGGPIEDCDKLKDIKDRLCRVIRANDGERGGGAGRTAEFFSGLTHMERRLHQMMSADEDHCGESRELEGRLCDETEQRTVNGKGRPTVTIRNCVERGYSVVNIHCQDRSKLLFDTVCTLTDMDYMIFHATILSEGYFAYQEFYIRHTDGCTLETDDERQRLIKRLVAAIQRRFPEGLRLELCTYDRVGLLSDVTKVFHRHGLCVTRAYISTTRAGTVANTFYVTDAASGDAVDMRTVEAIREELGQAMLNVRSAPVCPQLLGLDDSPSPRFSLAAFFKLHSERILYSLGLITSKDSAPSTSRAAAL
ncbi:hypothetical protein SELMODRAFT_405352 [Selaginella moellendorffii]|uniref:ACT domain-containing protein n=1 Tax=Selaginella moellendorffii TaxID=88036 RepID=D8QX26_SELML|nr:ACT domain-containing protein ACR6 [Selaginella moellendorffii]EFJ35337.1 hypothetical protein SELMODRAFT_405352 [Selaginella moellendorffii]|eukprot:XP_002963466.1 ACT domain-containing protein ACR6 [Selaginella moellendorffii]